MQRYPLLLIAIVMAGCATSKGPGTSEHPVWPKPPERPRFMYESVIRNEMDVTRENAKDAFRLAITGMNPKTSAAFVKPYDIAARNGRILVSDSAGTLVHLFDIAQGEIHRIGRGEKGRLVGPSGVTIDKQDNIYVADLKAKRVVVYNAFGHFKHALGSPDVFTRPSDVAVNAAGDRVYVVDFGGIESDRHRVVIFNGEGKMVGTFGQHGRALGEFHLASHIAVGPDDNVYVLDAGNFRVQVFDRDGKFLRTWGKVGVNIGDMARPRGLGIDTDGNVYVTDGTFGNFQVFDAQGQLLMWIGNTGVADKPGEYALPAGIAVDELNFVYVVDQMYSKVEIIRRLSAEDSDRLARNLPLNRSVRTPVVAPVSSNAPPPVDEIGGVTAPVAAPNLAAPAETPATNPAAP